MTTDTGLLARAAVRLRDHANAATPGPWVHDDYGPSGQNLGCGLVMTEHPDGFGGVITDPADPYPRGINRPVGNMAYIALMHPPVALALADLLGALHDDVYERIDFDQRLTHVEQSAVALARAILREDQP